MSIIAAEMLALQRLYEWKKTAPGRIALTQPMGIAMLNAEAVTRAGEGAALRAGSLAGPAPAGRQRDAGPARTAGLPGGGDHRLDGGQRHHHAHLQGQAQPHRGNLLGALRALGVFEQQGDLAGRVRPARWRAAQAATGLHIRQLWWRRCAPGCRGKSPRCDCDQALGDAAQPCRPGNWKPVDEGM